jgi:hypothetical protein
MLYKAWSASVLYSSRRVSSVYEMVVLNELQSVRMTVQDECLIHGTWLFSNPSACTPSCRLSDLRCRWKECKRLPNQTFVQQQIRRSLLCILKQAPRGLIRRILNGWLQRAKWNDDRECNVVWVIQRIDPRCGSRKLCFGQPLCRARRIKRRTAVGHESNCPTPRGKYSDAHISKYALVHWTWVIPVAGHPRPMRGKRSVLKSFWRILHQPVSTCWVYEPV